MSGLTDPLRPRGVEVDSIQGKMSYPLSSDTQMAPSVEKTAAEWQTVMGDQYHLKKGATEFLAAGADKEVREITTTSVAREAIPAADKIAKDWVLIVPKKLLRGLYTKTANLVKELKTMRRIRAKLQEQNQGPAALKGLALDFIESDKALKVGSRKVKAAYLARRGMPLDKAFGEFTFKQSQSAGASLLGGYANLHKGPFAHGDGKPDNCLVVDKDGENVEVQITDFGRTVDLPDDESDQTRLSSYKGNARYMAPEGTVSKKADVYSAGMQLIKTLEEPILAQEHKQGLLDVDKADRKPSRFEPSEKRRGVERFVLQHKAFIGAWENSTSLRNRSYASNKRKAMRKSKPEERQQQCETLGTYIDKLAEGLQKRGMLTEQTDGEFRDLLKSMTHHDPQQRPTAEEALNKYNKIFGLAE